MKIAGAGMVLALVLCLAFLLAACEREEPELNPTATPPQATEEALRETATLYERALAHLDLGTAYGFESTEFRQACPFERYGEMITSPQGDDCGFGETSEIDFVIESLEMGDNWGAVYGCTESENGHKCCFPDYKLWDYKDGRWAPTSTVPCAYALENERLLATLPDFPGAQRISTDSSFYSTEYESIPDRASLLMTYQVPPDADAQNVIDYYSQSLGADWQLAVEEYPWDKGKHLVAIFTRGRALVSLNTSSTFEGGLETLQVYVDQGGAKPTPVPLEPAERAKRDARTKEILLESEVGEALFGGREERQDYWVVDIAHVEPLVHGERSSMVTIAFAEPVSYEGEIPTVSDPCTGTRGDYVADDPCHDAPWVYGTQYATFSSVRDFHFRIEVDRGELMEVFSASSSADIVDDMIEQAKSAEQQ